MYVQINRAVFWYSRSEKHIQSCEDYRPLNNIIVMLVNLLSSIWLTVQQHAIRMLKHRYVTENCIKTVDLKL